MTTYIESKLNPDGTYDHSEVIEACHSGAEIEFFFSGCEWVNVKKSLLGRAAWYTNVKYRAVIEETHQEMIKRCDDETELCWLIRQKFQSGNAIPVERITLTRAEVNEVFPGLLK